MPHFNWNQEIPLAHSEAVCGFERKDRTNLTAAEKRKIKTSLRLYAPLAAVLLLSVSVPSLALNPRNNLNQYIIRTWQVDQGLPQSAATQVLQTRDQYLWIGTQNGLARFDGVRFRIYDKTNTPAMRSSYISALCEDRRGRLWIGTEGGGLTVFEAGRFSTFTTADGLSSDRIWSLREDGSGILWIGTAGGGLCFRKDGKFSIYSTAPSLAKANIRALHADQQGNIWVATQSSGLFLIKNGACRVITVKDGLVSNSLSSLTEDGRGVLWIGTDKGLNEWNAGRVNIYDTRAGLPDNRIRTLFCDNQGALWIGTRNGLCRMKDGRFESLTSREGLTNDLIFTLCEDREGSLWVGTYKGLNQLKDGKVISYAAKEGLSAEFASTLFEDREGTLWVGTLGGGLNRLSGGRFTALTTRNGLSNDTVDSIAEGRDGSLWVGTDRGLNRKKNGAWKVYTQKDGLPDDGIYTLYVDRPGTLWIGTAKGLAKWDGSRFSTIAESAGLLADSVTCMAEDKAGVLWIGLWAGGQGGLYFKKSDSPLAFSREEKLAGKRINTLYCDRDGVLWVGTEDLGLKRLRQGDLASFTARDGLGTDNIFHILEDDYANFWFSSFNGIYKVAKKDLQDFGDGKIKRIPHVAFGTPDGMKNRECSGGTQPAGWKTRDGRLWFPTSDGVVMIDPGHLNQNTLPPPVLLESFLVDDQPWPADIKPGKRAVFPPGIKRIEFQFTALSFLVPEKVLFKYRLEGFDRDWINAGTRRSAMFTNIPAGKNLRFRVIACNNDGVWNETGASFEFKLKPYFYQTYWFYGLCVFAAILTATAGYMVRVRRLKQRKEELEDLVSKRTKELETEKEKSEGLLLNILPAELVRELKENGRTKSRRYESATIIFSDFKSFTTIAATLPAETLVGELNDIFTEFDRIVARHGLEKIKTIGDAYLFAGGLPIEREGHAFECVRAAVEMQEFLAVRNRTSAVKWQMRTGVHSGSVVAGVVGSRKFTYDIWGDTVNIASRMQETAEPGGVNLSAFAYSLVKDGVDCEYCGKVEIKGKGPMDVYSVRKLKSPNAAAASGGN